MTSPNPAPDAMPPGPAAPALGPAASAAFLFSVDLEDVRNGAPDGDRYPDRVPHNTCRYLDFLDRQRARCTFFVVGAVARRHPDLVREIAARGHEIACHSDDHTHLQHHTRESFGDDLDRCLESFARVGIEGVSGYRAPAATLVESTSWAHEVLAERGFRYSSSVLAGRVGPRGWDAFGDDRPVWHQGLWELPFSLVRLPGMSLPFCAGVFFRALPFPLVRSRFRRRLSAGQPVTGYFHPFDIDDEQERFQHPEIGPSRLLNWLMYHNRGAVLGRLERLASAGWPIVPYREYVEQVLQPSREG